MRRIRGLQDAMLCATNVTATMVVVLGMSGCTGVTSSIETTAAATSVVSETDAPPSSVMSATTPDAPVPATSTTTTTMLPPPEYVWTTGSVPDVDSAAQAVLLGVLGESIVELVTGNEAGDGFEIPSWRSVSRDAYLNVSRDGVT